jgi:hypothetical protein
MPIIREVLRVTAKPDLDLPPPLVGQAIHRKRRGVLRATLMFESHR